MDNDPHTAPSGTEPARQPGDGLPAEASVQAEKQAWRRRLAAAREARTAAARAADGRLLAAAFAGWLARDVHTLAAYAGVGTEPPTRVLLVAVAASGRTVLLPAVLRGGVLDWAAYDGWDQLVRGPIGLREPAGPRLGAGALASVDLVVAPALAVDRTGTRLGRGGGYYDRALTGVAPAHVVAVVFDDEIVARLPREEHDRPVGAALTPSGIVALNG